MTGERWLFVLFGGSGHYGIWLVPDQKDGVIQQAVIAAGGCVRGGRLACDAPESSACAEDENESTFFER